MDIKKIGRFQLGRTLGSGNQGTVYLGHDTRLERRVAIKLLNRSMSGDAFSDEARTMSKLQHPNIVSIYEAGLYEGIPYLVFEYVEGVLLSSLIQGKRMELSRVSQIFQGLLEGMAEAHGSGIVHRDLKPANIIINRNKVPKIMDFGIARLLAERTEPDQELIGTPRYLAPEYIQYGEVGPQADVFALGVILDEMLTGMPVFSGSQQAAVIHAILNVDPVSPSQFNRNVDEKLDRFVLKALSKDPALRYNDAAEMLQAYNSMRAPNSGVSMPDRDASGTVEFLLRRIKRRSDFPALSNSVRSINAMNESNEDINHMASVIVKDFALTNKILKVVNSAYYGRFSGHIGTVSRAVVVLGIKAIRSLAASLIFFEHIENKQQAEQLRKMISLAIFRATVAHHIASETDSKEVEEYFLTALLRDLGKLLVAFYLPEESKDIERLETLDGWDTLSAQQSILGVGYEKIGIEIARLWNFPQSLVESLRGWEEKGKPVTQVEKRRLVSTFADKVMCILLSTDSKGAVALKKLVKQYSTLLNIRARTINEQIQHSVDELKQMADALVGDISPVLIDQLTKSSEMLLSPVVPYEEKYSHQDDYNSDSNIDDTDTVTDSFSTRTGVMARPASVQENTDTLLMNGLNEVTCMLVGEHSVSEVFNVVLETMYRAVGFHRVVLALLDRKHGQIAGRLGFGEVDETFINKFIIPSDYSVDLFQGALKNSVDLYIADTMAEKTRSELPDWYTKISNAGSLLLLPLVIRKRAVGLIYADHLKPHGLNIDVQRLNILKSLRNQIVLAVK